MPTIEMISSCPRCGDYYADQSLAFCPGDGTPLVKLEAGSERWSEATKVLEKKVGDWQRRQQWRTLRKVVLATMALLSILAYGLAARRYIYLVPVASPLPSPSLITPGPSPIATLSVLRSQSPSPTPTPPGVTNKVVKDSTPTPTPTRRSTPTPTPTPLFSPTPTPAMTATPILTIKTEVCSADDQRREEQIIRGYFPAWRRDIPREKPRIIAGNIPDGAREPEAIIIGEINFNLSFAVPCTVAVITAQYEWRVTYSLNGTPAKPKIVPRKKTIRCGKLFGIWGCPLTF